MKNKRKRNLKLARRLLRLAKRIMKAAEWVNEEEHVDPVRKDSQGNLLADIQGSYTNFTGRIKYYGSDALVSNAEFELIPDSTAHIIWKSGVWESGVWESGRWLSTHVGKQYWKSGVWKGGFSGASGMSRNSKQYHPEGDAPNHSMWRTTISYENFTGKLTLDDFRTDCVDATFCYSLDGEYCNWESGTWKDGNLINGCWKDGIWKGGNWGVKDSYKNHLLWLNGTWEGGHWYGGDWISGDDSKGFRHETGDAPNRRRWAGHPADRSDIGSLSIDTIRQRRKNIENNEEYDVEVSLPVAVYYNYTGEFSYGDFDADVKDATFIYDKRKEFCTWEKGTWVNGAWHGGLWKDGTWKEGIWKKGTWKKGDWEDGTWWDGTWEDGTWTAGDWALGIWEKGTWVNGYWSNGTWKNGTWKNGTWEKGTWEKGTWEKGKDINGKRHGKGNYPGTYGWPGVEPSFDNQINMGLHEFNNESGEFKHGDFEVKFRNATFTFNAKTNKCDWKSGTWENGTWTDGTWETGSWEKGTWQNGIWKKGNWMTGTWEDGEWNEGTWDNGTWLDGTWKGGIWRDGTWKAGDWIRGRWIHGYDANFNSHERGDAPNRDNWDIGRFARRHSLRTRLTARRHWGIR